jgi:predicted lipoprotein with Yx(FWY)xxD motif
MGRGWRLAGLTAGRARVRVVASGHATAREGIEMITSRQRDRSRPPGILPAAVVALAVTAVAAAGCSSSGPAAPPAPVPSATGRTVSAQPTSLGTILVDGKGRTVYDFANDKNGRSTCTGQCAANWLFVPAPAPLPKSLPGVTGALGSTTRPDGGRQLTVAGHPVYTFVGDSAPGQTNGQGIVLNGGLWTVVSPAGAPLPGARPAAATSAPPAGPIY